MFPANWGSGVGSEITARRLSARTDHRPSARPNLPVTPQSMHPVRSIKPPVLNLSTPPACL